METKLITKLQDKEYRDAFVASQINIELPFQVRALREARGWTQSQLAEKAGMAQPRISAIETPGKGKFNLDTLLRLASAFDVGLVVRFAPFSEMIEWAEHFSPDSFEVPSFEEDRKSFFWRKQSTPSHFVMALPVAERKGGVIVPTIVATTPGSGNAIKVSEGPGKLYNFPEWPRFPTGGTAQTVIEHPA